MKFPSWDVTIWIIVLSLIVGGGAGVLATSYTSSYLSDYALELSELTSPLRLTQQQPRTFPNSLHEAMQRFKESNAQSLGSVYPTNLQRPNGYLERDAYATGVVLTSDGWMVFPKGSVTAYRNSVVVLAGNVHEIEDVVGTDHATFVNIDANGLGVIGYGQALDTVIGEQVIVSSGPNTVSVNMISSHVRPYGQIVSSDVLHRRLMLDQTTTPQAPVFSLSGDLLGVLEADGESVIPLQTFLPAFSSYLEQEVIVRPVLGVSTLSLSHAINIDEELSQSRRSGALVTKRNDLHRNGPAREAGLQAGDIILMVDGQTVNGRRSLDEYITQYKPGDNITLTVARDGEELEIELELGSK